MSRQVMYIGEQVFEFDWIKDRQALQDWMDSREGSLIMVGRHMLTASARNEADLEGLTAENMPGGTDLKVEKFSEHKSDEMETFWISWEYDVDWKMTDQDELDRKLGNTKYKRSTV